MKLKSDNRTEDIDNTNDKVRYEKKIDIKKEKVDIMEEDTYCQDTQRDLIQTQLLEGKMEIKKEVVFKEEPEDIVNFKEEIKDEEEDEEENKEEGIYYNPKITSIPKKLAEKKLKTINNKIVKNKATDTRFITDDIREMRKVKCKVCGEIFLGYSIDMHVKVRHKNAYPTYGPFNEYINLSFYR